jgi:microcompartment protein CcmL/EutN
MTNSICIIETRSLALTSQVLQQILRSEKIELLNLQIPGDGSVISFIFGEYSEIKSAMESASEISKSVTSYFSQKIITKPDEKLFELLQLKRSAPAKTEVFKADKKRISIKKSITTDSASSKGSVFGVAEIIKPDVTEIPADSITKKKAVSKSLPKTEKEAEVKKEKTEVAVHQPFKEKIDNPTIARLKKEALGIKERENVLDKTLTNLKESETENEGDGPADLEQLKIFNVHKLRRYARSFNGFPIKGREISRANREVLLNYFKELI